MKLRSPGAIELEIVNSGPLRRIITPDNEARKLNVQEDLRELRELEELQGLLTPNERDKVKALVHCNTLADFGKDYDLNIADAWRRIECLC